MSQPRTATPSSAYTTKSGKGNSHGHVSELSAFYHVKPGHEVEERRLPRPGGARHGIEAAGLEPRRDRRERRLGRSGEPLRHRVEAGDDTAPPAVV